MASLPLDVYRKNSDTTVTKLNGSQLLDNPSADVNTTLYDWMFQCLSSALLNGNAWGLISSRTGVTSPNGLGYPQTVEWLPTDRVSVQDDPDQPYNPLRARVYYNGQLMDRNELVQVRAFVIPGRLEAISPMRAFSALFDQGLDALYYSATWFKNGGFPPGTFQNIAEEVDETQAREIRRRLTDTLRLHEPLVYGKDWDYKPVVVPPNEAAFVQAMQLNATQVAAVYGVPPTKVGGMKGDSLTYANVQEENISLITDTLRPWLVRMEHLFSALLPKPQFVRFNTDALLKTDLKTRTQIYEIQRRIGLRPIDEIREIEDLPALPHGVGTENIPLDMLVRMAATTRAIPKTMLSEVVIEAAMVSELLQYLSKQGLAPTPGEGAQPGEPAPPPVTMDAEQYLARLLTQARATRGGEENASGADGHPAEPLDAQFFGPRHQRATRTDRERAVSWLAAAQHAGCLDGDECEERTAKAKMARIKGSLDQLVKDLPSAEELRRASPAAPAEEQESSRLNGQAAQALTILRGMRAEFSPEDHPVLLNGSRH